MDELEKLREEIGEKYNQRCRDARAEFDRRMNVAMNDFIEAMNRAREIERQAGIGGEK